MNGGHLASCFQLFKAFKDEFEDWGLRGPSPLQSSQNLI